MLTLHPNILEKDGKKAFVVLPYEEFLAIQKQLHDLDDLKELRAAKAEEGHAPTTPLASVRKSWPVFRARDEPGAQRIQ